MVAGQDGQIGRAIEGRDYTHERASVAASYRPPSAWKLLRGQGFAVREFAGNFFGKTMDT
jgi:hypothetical protein